MPAASSGAAGRMVGIGGLYAGGHAVGCVSGHISWRPMLRFPLFGIPVGVHYSFLLIAVLLAGTARDHDLGVVLATIGATLGIFASVLLHEAGHAFTARAYGAEHVSITLFALGGLTTYSNDPPLSPGKRFVITAAGSGVAVVVGGVLWLGWEAGMFDGASEFIRWTSGWFIFASVLWGLLNWIPIRPLDGGQMLTAALEMWKPARADMIARVVTVLTGGALIVVLLVKDEPFLAAYVAFIAFLGVRRGPRSREDEIPAREESGGGSGVAREGDRPGPEPEHEEPPFPI